MLQFSDPMGSRQGGREGYHHTTEHLTIQTTNSLEAKLTNSMSQRLNHKPCLAQTGQVIQTSTFLEKVAAYKDLKDKVKAFEKESEGRDREKKIKLLAKWKSLLCHNLSTNVQQETPERTLISGRGTGAFDCVNSKPRRG